MESALGRLSLAVVYFLHILGGVRLVDGADYSVLLDGIPSVNDRRREHQVHCHLTHDGKMELILVLCLLDVDSCGRRGDHSGCRSAWWGGRRHGPKCFLQFLDAFLCVGVIVERAEDG
jgi:hypothetical protein